ncbi:MAG: endonuclease/exonuclease/phosphatase family protein [Methylacidiphilales bacterium]|nr:endonuclease/exonuclease/phosphatase family protein [Candidatus Methylacidiphilales bacterium]NJR15977.1 endonuclease/exonuclease/phosphatase family protein [Calothrix sp. CSU_2_0]
MPSLMLKKILIFSIGIALICLTFASFVSYKAWFWPLELLAHFRLQYLIVSLIISTSLLILWWRGYFKYKLLIFLSLMLVGLNSIGILPWYLPHSQQINNASQPLRILQFNLNPDNDHFSEVAEVVKEQKPDVALFIEVDKNAVEQLNTKLKDILPYSFRSPGGGLALFTRQPFRDAKGDKLNGDATNLLATLEINNKPIQLIGTHPTIPIKPSTFHRRNRQLTALSSYVSTLKVPVIVFGDFNLTPWSPYYREFVQKSGLHNASLGYGILPSWPRSATHVRYPNWLIPLMNIPIDHCFVTKEFRIAGIRTSSHANSDHAPLITDLVLP